MGFCSAEIHAQPSIVIGRSRSIRVPLGFFWPRQGGKMKAQAQVASTRGRERSGGERKGAQAGP
jgi:hypothetical protein